MFRKDQSLSQRLNLVLKDYEKEAGSDALTFRMQFPANEVWRLFIDGLRQDGYYDLSVFANLEVLKSEIYADFNLLEIAKTPAVYGNWNFLANHLMDYFHINESEAETIKIGDLVKYNAGWFFFEKCEPGYLLASYKAFQCLYENHNELTLDYILKLHRIVMSNVKNSNYDSDESLSLKRPVRNTSICFYISSINATKEGIYEIITECSSYGEIYVENIPVNLITGRHIRRLKLSKEAKNIINEYPDNFEKLRKSKTKRDVSYAVMKFIHTDAEIRYWANNATDSEKTCMDLSCDVIDEYNASIIKLNSAISKLHCIVKLVKHLERIHMFYDGNCRTFCMLLLNHLLIKNGFPLCIQDNPNRFDASSQDQLVAYVIQGMENTFKLLKTGKLYGVRSSDLIHSFHYPDSFGLSHGHFSKAFAVEERARSRIDRHLKRKHPLPLPSDDFPRKYQKRSSC